MSCTLPPKITADKINDVVTQMGDSKNVRRGLLGGRSFTVTVQGKSMRVSLNAVIREAKTLGALDDSLKARFTEIDTRSSQASGFLQHVWKLIHAIRSFFFLAGKHERTRLLASQPASGEKPGNDTVKQSKPLCLDVGDYRELDAFIEAFLKEHPNSDSLLQVTRNDQGIKYLKFFDCKKGGWLDRDLFDNDAEIQAEYKSRLHVITEQEFADFKVSYEKEQKEAVIKKLESYRITHDLNLRINKARTLYMEMQRSDARYGNNQQRIYVCFNETSIYIVGPAGDSIRQKLIPRTENSLAERVKEMLDAIKKEHQFNGRIVIVGNPAFFDDSGNYVYEQSTIDY